MWQDQPVTTDNRETAVDRHERRRLEALALQAEFDGVDAEGREAVERGDAEAVQLAQTRKKELIEALRALSGEQGTVLPSRN